MLSINFHLLSISELEFDLRLKGPRTTHEEWVEDPHSIL